VQAGNAMDWGDGVALPDSVLRRVVLTFENLSIVVKRDQEVRVVVLAAHVRLVAKHQSFHMSIPGWGVPRSYSAMSTLLPQQMPVADFLAEGDHVTRMLKEWGDSLDKRLPPPQLATAGASDGAQPQALPSLPPGDIRACVLVLRCVLLLTRLAGRFIVRYLPQLLVLLAAGLRSANPREVRLQCLEGWLGLVRALAAEAQLGGLVNQASAECGMLIVMINLL
jgi:hypothetical protein